GNDFCVGFAKGRLPAKAGTEPCGSSATAGQGRLPAKAGTEPRESVHFAYKMHGFRGVHKL
ncbi:MAG: hypothetical protein FWE24_09075, partial [Defluviitaleaceae bacterium]|nr:hypothetical protein [Defluviitaleaceae bacterium]